MMKKIVYTGSDGGVCIVHPAPKQDLEKVLGPLTQQEYEAHIRERSIPHDAINPISIEDADIPSDRYFRDAWRQDGKVIGVDMDKARTIHMKHIRKLRDKALEKLDIETMKGKDVQKEKQKLRDLPQTFDLTKAETPEALKNLIPEDLK